ncbi:MAG: cupin domain-containing protein [Hyphomicrobium sp.]
MNRKTNSSQLQHVLAALVAAGAVSLVAVPASAGTCPSGKVTTDGQKAGATAHKDVSEKLLGQIDLSKEQVAVAGHHFRMRRLDIKPGGEVAWHSHGERPALIYVVSGSITEYSSHCQVPIVHTAGELSVEQGGLSHWWKNTTDKPVVLISADIAKDPEANGM